MFKLTKRHRQLLHEIDAFTKAIGLNPDQVLSDWEGDSEGITAHLTRIIGHLLRAEIIGRFTYVDELLGMELARHIFRSSKSERRSRARTTFWAVLRELYPLQKLRVIRGYRRVPKSIVAIIHAVNNLRNTAAHEFGLGFSRRHGMKYKGLSLFTATGIERLQTDVDEVEKFFAPWIARIRNSTRKATMEDTR
jgi:hypothetical protein